MSREWGEFAQFHCISRFLFFFTRVLFIYFVIAFFYFYFFGKLVWEVAYSPRVVGDAERAVFVGVH